MCQPSGVDIWRAVSFWTKNLIDVLIWSFSKNGDTIYDAN